MNNDSRRMSSSSARRPLLAWGGTLLVPQLPFVATSSGVFCSRDAGALSHVPSTRVLDGDKALPHFCACYQFCHFSLSFFLFFQNLLALSVHCLL